MADEINDIMDSAAKFAAALAALNATANQQALQILQMAVTAVSAKSLNETDVSQAIVESKLAQQLNTQERVRRMFAPPTEEKK